MLIGLLLFAGGLGLGYLLQPTCPSCFENQNNIVDNQVDSDASTISLPIEPQSDTIMNGGNATQEISRQEISVEIRFAERVRAVAEGLRLAGTASYLEAYQLSAAILTAPWTEVEKSREAGFSRIDAMVVDQKVRVAFREGEIYLVLYLEDNFLGIHCHEPILQIRLVHNGLKFGSGFEELWVSLYYRVGMEDEALSWLDGLEAQGLFPEYEVVVLSEDSYTREDHPDMIDPSSVSVWGISNYADIYSKVEQSVFGREGSVVDRGLCQEVHERLKALVRGSENGAWPVEGESLLPAPQ